MTTFFDTSVLISAFNQRHIYHRQSLEALISVDSGQGVCGAHTLAEFYASTTRMPAAAQRFEPEEALLSIEQIAGKLAVITLSAEEYLDQIRKLPAKGIPGGQIYDALLLACARKAESDRILTFNLKHFRKLAPDLADRIVTP